MSHTFLYTTEIHILQILLPQYPKYLIFLTLKTLN